MRSCWNHRLGILVLAIVMGCPAKWGICTVDGRVQGKPGVFFSQGQAVHDPGDRVKSQQEAVRDFLAQALIQAVGRHLSPAQMGSRMEELQGKILNQPGRYIKTYQIFSEAPGANGLYRVTGEVAVAVELLREDLERLGWIAAPPAAQPEPPPEDAPDDSIASGPPPTGESEAASRGLSLSRKELLWVVTEKWDDEDGFLSEDHRDPRGIFLRSVSQESKDFDWTLRVPEAESLDTGSEGDLSDEESTALARRLGIGNVVVGRVVLQPEAGDEKVEVALRLIDASSGRVNGEIRREWSKADASIQEGAMELAAMVVPQIERLLATAAAQGEDRTAEAPERQPAEGEAAEQVAVEEPLPAMEDSTVRAGDGEWVLRIRSPQQYARWAEMEQILRDQFKSMQVKSLRLGPHEATVIVDGVDGEFLKTLHGTRLREGLQVQLDAFSPNDRSLLMTFILSEQKQ